MNRLALVLSKIAFFLFCSTVLANLLTALGLEIVKDYRVFLSIFIGAMVMFIPAFVACFSIAQEQVFYQHLTMSERTKQTISVIFRGSPTWAYGFTVVVVGYAVILLMLGTSSGVALSFPENEIPPNIVHLFTSFPLMFYWVEHLILTSFANQKV